MIDVHNLTKHYGPVRAVDDLTFTVKPGVVTGFLGPNGAGKSTTMRMILGLDSPTSGTALIDGSPYASLKQPARRVGALLDAKGVHPNRSARASLLWQAQASGIPDARVDEVLSLVGLSDVASKRAGGFSLGMGQRLGIASALLGDPEYLILDEPVNGLDPEGIRWVRGLLRALADEGRTILVSSHLLAEMAQTADHLIVIGRGKLVADTSVHDFIKGNSAVITIVRPVDTAAMEAALAAAGVSFERGVDPDGRPTIAVADRSSEEIGAVAFRAGVQLAELSERRASLEDAYIRSTEGHIQYQAQTQDTSGGKHRA
ncbi:ABC transporter ATP-binding protein [Corynebacterium sanguinis]|uniref:ABC transporter ATP-binding protein n=1 Tax=Corynebacterium sanguinis TaxID=2594913 RepID=UPI00119FFEBC|nr:ABC transporter ATP-binding protein [Corynebacterium sanguinis]MCT1694901.1 ABC transporter ATP-binding protein [Corynebacterium sanguinis]MCT1714298.1 ABC transporter ATP-binding protein [Corynebacterium sanguinis]MCT1804192.1 ABC transporter ATP-binding protein [Corynebacterium sanguinis]TVS21274.1 ABC transporter ATP-binding protein [Corynebacterium sanguinis]TVS23640.1 ABC transporter ATP-binding protein [Corynebacterium sanguinis]